jgi:hypothetical protein
MEQDRRRREMQIEGFAENSEDVKGMYKNDLESYIDQLGIDRDLEEFDKRIVEKGDNEELREELNDYIEAYACVEPMPKDYPIQNYRKWIVDNHAENYSFDEWMSDNWDSIEEMWLEHYDVIYNANLTKIENDIHNYVEEHNYDMKYEEEQSRSWNAGRYPSIYFIFSKRDIDDEEEPDEYTLRISDGHDNGRSSDYEMVFDEYDKDELESILDEIREFYLDLED